MILRSFNSLSPPLRGLNLLGPKGVMEMSGMSAPTLLCLSWLYLQSKSRPIESVGGYWIWFLDLTLPKCNDR